MGETKDDVVGVIALAVATTRHPRTGEIMVGRGAKKRAANIVSVLKDAGYHIVSVDEVVSLTNEKNIQMGRARALAEERDRALALAKRHMEQRHRVLREARLDWDTLQGAIARLTDEAAHMRQAIDEEVRCLGHLENELRGRLDGEAALKFFPVIQRAQQRLNEARDHQG